MGYTIEDMPRRMAEDIVEQIPELSEEFINQSVSTDAVTLHFDQVDIGEYEDFRSINVHTNQTTRV